MIAFSLVLGELVPVNDGVPPMLLVPSAPAIEAIIFGYYETFIEACFYVLCLLNEVCFLSNVSSCSSS